MKLKILLIPFCLSIISLNTSAGILFEDSFESGDLSTTNTEGFSWNGTNRTSIVTSTTRVYANNAPDNTPKSNLSPSGDWTPKPNTGSHSLRFSYPAGVAQSEQRFNLGAPHRDIWFRYWLRIPSNYSHTGSNPTNRKLFALWMDGYSNKGDGPTVIWEFWDDGNSGSRLAFHYSEGGYTGAGRHHQHVPFISYPTDQGRWMQIVLHVRAATSATSNDGIIQMWRRWDNEGSFTKLHDTTTANIPAPHGGPNGWKAGYVMGWANASYSDDTEWLMDDFTISNEPLIVTPRRITSLLIK